MTLLTIGYEGLSTDAFKALLVANEVECVVDIRALPFSRKPGFSKTALSHWLMEAGFGYRHMPSLGCPKPVRDAYREDADWPHYARGFAQHLNSQSAALHELAQHARQQRSALLCFEADANYCHRSLVAQALQTQCGFAVAHIQRDVKTTRFADRLLLAA